MNRDGKYVSGLDVMGARPLGPGARTTVLGAGILDAIPQLSILSALTNQGGGDKKPDDAAKKLAEAQRLQLQKAEAEARRSRTILYSVLGVLGAAGAGIAGYAIFARRSR